MQDKPYFFINGIKQLVRKLSGRENIYLGIRPYGFHAGNQMPFMVYPYFLCQETEKYGKKARYTFFLFLNDWEQDALEGPDVINYPFNVLPQNTTFQFLPSPEKGKTMVDFWEPIIVSNVEYALRDFREVQIKAVRNSSMKLDPIMKYVVLTTIKQPWLVKETLQKYSGKQVLDVPTVYSSAICRVCHSAKTETVVLGKDIIKNRCLVCGHEDSGPYHEYDYWLYHKPLALPRIKSFNIDVCISGLDHYNEGDFVSRRELFKAYDIKVKYPKMLYTPLVLGYNGLPMGKSRKNDKFVELERLLEKVEKMPNQKIIKISD